MNCLVVDMILFHEYNIAQELKRILHISFYSRYCTLLEPIVGSEILLCDMFASQVQSKNENKRDTSVDPASLESV